MRWVAGDICLPSMRAKSLCVGGGLWLCLREAWYRVGRCPTLRRTYFWAGAGAVAFDILLGILSGCHHIPLCQRFRPCWPKGWCVLGHGVD